MGFHDLRMAWPGFRFAAMTTSWDDGQRHDRRVVEILNRHGVKGTFNLNSAKLADRAGPDGAHLGRDEIATLFAGHEIAAHTENHPWLEITPDEGVVAEVMRDRAALERLAGYPVKGMALPFGTYAPRTLAVLSACGILHCRTTRATRAFALPADFREWHPTCHQADADLFGLLDRAAGEERRPQLFYVWGHSYEFPRDDSWGRFEEFCAKAGGDARIWHATNMQVVDYVAAWRSLRWTADGAVAENPSATAVWLRGGGRELRVDPGARVRADA